MRIDKVRTAFNVSEKLFNSLQENERSIFYNHIKFDQGLRDKMYENL